MVIMLPKVSKYRRYTLPRSANCRARQLVSLPVFRSRLT
ncbi:Protein of unknown function [Pyronema omphalodes CBS 100304]|uniref:Uncharacterized protein n=1 Tax=Pyronema omphalodes (strain CBS 100304) TaxID=1076935 RepID=U4L700_PYROM|nr:Protein of unknown function [Pyronema omphalodes CBS 100304]